MTIEEDRSQLSDGYHTFDELYQHRHALMLALMRSNPEIAWFSSHHHDGTCYEGWFIVGLDCPAGMITYHLPNSYWNAAVETNAALLKLGREWDGHTSTDVIERLIDFAKNG
jgi:hypothetical protein